MLHLRYTKLDRLGLVHRVVPACRAALASLVIAFPQESAMPPVPAAVRDPDRLAALRSLRLLDTPAEPAFDRLTRLAATILRVPVALVSLVDEERQFFTSCIGLPEPWATTRQTPLSHSFCQHTVATAQPLIIEDARDHPLVRDNLAIPDLNVVAYAGIPLITDDGFVLGSFCVIDTQPRVWAAEELAILRDLAASVMTEISLRIARAQDARREATLQASYTEAQAALASRDRFLAIAAHDLNSPITALVGYATLLTRQGEPAGDGQASEQRMLHRIAEQAQRLSLMINALLDFSQIQQGQVTIDRRLLELGALLARVVERMQDAHPTAELAARVPEPPLWIAADEVRLEEAVQNVIQNAIKYSPAGSPITITVAPTVRDVTIAVTDRGRGIAPEDLPHLFDAFYRADAAGGTSGIGLGLYIVKAIMTAHDGTVDVASEVGRGTTVSLRVPRTTGAPSPASTSDTSPATAPPHA